MIFLYQKKQKMYAEVILGCLFFVFSFVFPATAGEEKTRANFFMANALYEKGNYDKAIGEYEAALGQGYESGPLYYNLANTYFKKGNLGKALLNYEKAKKLLPRDNDLSANYEYARSLVKFSQENHRVKGFFSLFGRIFEKFTINETMIILAILYYTAAVCLILNIRGILGKKRTLFIVIILLFLFLAGLIDLILKAKAQGKNGIVMPADAPVVYEPHEQATVYFTLFEGMKLKVIRCKDSWCKIEVPDKKTGWIKANTFETF